MRPLSVSCAALLFSLCCLASAQQAMARPTAVTLFPSGALVTETDTVHVKNGRIVLHLPAGADIDSLNVTLSAGSVIGRSLTLLPGQAAPAVAELQRELNDLRDTISLKYAELAGLAAQREFWTQPPYMLNAPTIELLDELMRKLAAEAEEQLAVLVAKEGAVRADIRVMEHRASVIEARMAELGQQNRAMRECVLSVQEGGSDPVRVQTTYWLADAGWQPQYRVTGDSASGRVAIRMDAAMRQNSGENWQDVAITLSSASQLHKVVPPSLRSWVIGENPVRYGAAPAANGLLKSSRSMSVGAAPLADATQEAAALSWTLGRLDLSCESSTIRFVGEHTLKGDILRLIRPSVSHDAWIQAELPEKTALALPAGQASFFVDGAETARGTFRLTPADRAIAFGTDQLVSVDFSNVADSHVEAGDSPVLQWNWLISLVNGHDTPIDVRVEEPAPVVRDTRIAIQASTTPEASLDSAKARYVWRLELPPRGSKELHYRVTAEMPEERRGATD